MDSTCDFVGLVDISSHRIPSTANFALGGTARLRYADGLNEFALLKGGVA